MMIPVVGVFSSALALGERPHWQDYAALLLVVASLATVLVPRRTPEPAEATMTATLPSLSVSRTMPGPSSDHTNQRRNSS